MLLSSNAFAWKIRSSVLRLDRPLIVGILNLTPDSFYDGGRFLNPEEALKQALRLEREGADLIDLGAESTRPGANLISSDEELNRLLPALTIIKKTVKIPVSIDTTKSAVASVALECGAEVINDVSGLRADPRIADLIRDFRAGLVLMHRRGDAQTMQSFAQYSNLLEDIKSELSESIEIAKSRGVGAEQMVIDPGIGFSKTAEQNFEVLSRLSQLKTLGRPVLVGPSRKSFIGLATGEGAQSRLHGTIAACVMAYERGASILRVHDVKEVKEAILVAEKILNDGEKVLT